jgi:hypothetical protein
MANLAMAQEFSSIGDRRYRRNAAILAARGRQDTGVTAKTTGIEHA